jgi:hypothetical protein
MTVVRVELIHAGRIVGPEIHRMVAGTQAGV